MNRLVIATLVVAVLAGCSSAGPTATASPAATLAVSARGDSIREYLETGP
jgi:di/tricarboxylate transporter